MWCQPDLWLFRLSYLILILVNSSEVAAVTAAVTNVAVKVPAHSVSKKTGPWTTSREPAKLWRQEIDGRNVFTLPQNCC